MEMQRSENAAESGAVLDEATSSEGDVTLRTRRRGPYGARQSVFASVGPSVSPTWAAERGILVRRPAGRPAQHRDAVGV